MENTCAPTDDIATPAPNHPQLDCLKDMADALLQAYKDAPVPKDHAGIGMAARTLISLTRLIKAVYDKGAAAKRRPPTPPSVAEDTTVQACDTTPGPIPVLNRKQRRREDKFRRAVKTVEPVTLALSP